MQLKLFERAIYAVAKDIVSTTFPRYIYNLYFHREGRDKHKTKIK